MWEIDADSGPIYLQIVKGVERMLANGQMAPGEKLPSARDLAVEANVNPNTVMRAFAELEANQISETKRGLGTFIREDVNVAALRGSVLSAAARQYLGDVKRLGLTIKDAKHALEEAEHAG